MSITKKAIITILSFIVIFAICICAYFFISPEAFEKGEKYTYVHTDGTVYEYYLGDDGNAYYYEGREKVYLPFLPQYQITDEEQLSKLREEFNITDEE